MTTPVAEILVHDVRTTATQPIAGGATEQTVTDGRRHHRFAGHECADGG
jgi:hypothetical protein